MSKHNRKTKLPPFVAIPWKILNSETYKNMSYSAAKALPYFLGKPKAVGLERYEIVFDFSYREAQRYGFGSKVFSKIIKELVELNIIDFIEYGGLENRKNLFRLSKYLEKFNSPKTDHSYLFES